MDFNRKILLCTLALAVCMLFVTPVYADQGGAQSAISSAQSNIKDCYIAVRGAEAAGANVNSLMVKLNDAAVLLSKAQLAYSGKDYDAAYNYASECQSQLGDLVTQANAAKSSANGNVGMLFEVMSLGVSAGLICAGVAAWVVLGKRQRRPTYQATTV